MSSLYSKSPSRVLLSSIQKLKHILFFAFFLLGRRPANFNSELAKNFALNIRPFFAIMKKSISLSGEALRYAKLLHKKIALMFGRRLNIFVFFSAIRFFFIETR